jgi:predicted secreted protein
VKTLAALALLAITRGSVEPGAEWHPTARFLREARSRCSQEKPAPAAACFAREMARSGAPKQAVSFTRMIRAAGYLRELHEAERVDIAYVAYPFQTSHRLGWLLVNGSPAVVDVDNTQKLPQPDMRADKAFAAAVPDLLRSRLFPGARPRAGGPTAILRANGSEEFIVDYRVLDGCFGCALLGFAYYGFDFDAKGKFQGTRYVRFAQEPDEDAAAARTRLARPIPAGSHETFTLILSANRGAGYRWRLANAPDKNVVKFVRSESHEPRRTELWTFETEGTGSAQLRLDYVHRVGNRQVAAQNLNYVVYSSDE